MPSTTFTVRVEPDVKKRRSAAAVALFLEYEAVLTRPEHLAKAGTKVAEAEIVLDVLAAVAEPVEPHFLWRPRLRDADDDMVLEAANGRAEAIVTFNARDYERARRADFAGFDRLMRRRDREAPRPDDEIPKNYRKRKSAGSRKA